MDFSPEKMKAHLAALDKKRDPLDAQRTALWAELDTLVSGTTKLTVAKAREREAAVRDEIKAVQSKLAPIDAERVIVVRALGPKAMLG